MVKNLSNWGPVIEIVESVLTGKMDAVTGADRIVENMKEQVEAREVTKSACAYRMLRSLANIKNGEESWHDFAGHLRQFILIHKMVLNISDDIAEELEKLKWVFSLRIEEPEGGQKQVDVSGSNEDGRGMPEWFKDRSHLMSVYDLEERKSTNIVPGDGILYKMTGYKYYSSIPQKSIIRAAMDLPEGFTLLGCLPTGGGKSLVFQMPSFYGTEGGMLEGAIGKSGTTIVVVPTIALSIDQANRAREYFKDAPDESHKPQAYYSEIRENKELMAEIRKGVSQGTLPILYTSPEAILSNTFRDMLIKAAGKGRIKYLVIDEAHIIVDWGSSFRTEFQFLSVFRKQLLEESKGTLKTILVSATLTSRTTQILKNMFSEEGRFIEVRGDALRIEPMYWVFKHQSLGKRRQGILEILPKLPRPLILYVNTRDDANAWRQEIEKRGFTRVASFTGDTSGSERKKIIERWNNNELDMIVATSAFGMGVDKGDIRTVIHCCVPESTNRFYQEVGRGGRDGLPSLSILSVVPEEDYKVTLDLTKDSVLTSEMISVRWKAMLKESVPVSGDSFWLNTNTRPPHLEHRKTGRPNANFNSEVILFLCRKGLIDILEIEKAEDELNGFRILVKMKPDEIDALTDENELIERIKEEREEERRYVTAEFEQIKSLIEKTGSSCFGGTFKKIYNQAKKRCGGCENCRMRGRIPDINSEGTLKIMGYEYFIDDLSRSKMMLDEKLDKFLGRGKEVLLRYDGGQYGVKDEKLYKLTANLVNSRITNIIIPDCGHEDWGKWVEELPYKNCIPYFIYSTDEIMGIMKDESNFLLTGPVAVIYPMEQEKCEEIFEWTQRYKKLREENRVIHIADRDLRIQSRDKLLESLINGIANDIDSFNLAMQYSEAYSDWI